MLLAQILYSTDAVCIEHPASEAEQQRYCGLMVQCTASGVVDTQMH